MTEDYILEVPDNGQLVTKKDVSSDFKDVLFRCPSCDVGTRLDLPRGDCRNCGTTLALILGHGPMEGSEDE